MEQEAAGVWVAITLRNPHAGGTLNYDTRVQRFTLDVNATTGAISNFQIAQTIKFSDSSGSSFASDADNTAGKRTNRGFEGLAIIPGGNSAYAMLQSAMLDEGSGDGTINRIVKFDTTTGKAVAQYAHEMRRSGQGQGISALVAINEPSSYVAVRARVRHDSPCFADLAFATARRR